MAKEKKKGGCGTFLIAILIMGAIGSIFGDDEPKEEKQNNQVVESQESTQKEDDTVETEVVVEEQKTFSESMSEFLSDEQMSKLDDILKNQIGFTDIKFIEKMGETLNYSITADGYDVVITDMGDDFRIFIPNSDTIFYDDGEVVTTLEVLEMKKIDQNDYSTYAIMAESIIESCLVSPSSADFPWHTEYGYEKFGDIVAVQGYVDAKNALGVEIRNQWVVQFTVLDMDTFSCQPIYINIDGEETGEFIEFE